MAVLSPEQIAALQKKIDVGDVAGFYADLQSYGDPYGALGLAVTQNSGWQARLSNAFAASGAAQNHVDLSYESPEWKALNKNLANDYLQRYKDNDFTSPSWNEIQKFHNDRYQRANIHPDSWLPNRLLNQSGDPAALWEDMLISDGGSDLLDDAASVATAGPLVIVPHYFVAASIADPNFVDQIRFANNFYTALVGLDLDDRKAMALDLGDSVMARIDGFIESVSAAARKRIDAVFNYFSGAEATQNPVLTANEAFGRLPDRVEPGMPPEVESLVLFKGDRALFDRQFDEIAGYESLDVVQDYLERRADMEKDMDAAPDMQDNTQPAPLHRSALMPAM